MKELKESVSKLVTEELSRANEKYPLFHSPHEGIAIVFEEFQEAKSELEEIKYDIEKAWMLIRINADAYDWMINIKKEAINVAAEAIQVSAMAKKYIDSFEGEKK